VLGESGELIYKGDLHGQEGVGGVFDQFRTGGGGGDEHRELVRLWLANACGMGKGLLQDRGVQLAQDVGGEGLVRPDHDPVRVEGVVQGGAFAQEFGVRGDVQAGVDLPFPQGGGDDGLHTPGRAQGDGGFDHYGKVGLFVHSLADLRGYSFDVGQVGVAVGLAGGADGDEDDVGLGVKAVPSPEGEGQVHGEQFFDAGLVDGHAPVGQAFNHLGVLVDAVDLVTDIGEGAVSVFLLWVGGAAVHCCIMLYIRAWTERYSIEGMSGH